MGEWEEYKIGDILILEYGKSLKNYRHYEGLYDVYGTNGKIGTTDKFIYDMPSLIIGRKGAYRGVHLAVRPFYVIDTAFYTKKRICELSCTFLYYWFKTINIDDMDSGSAIPSTSRDEVYELDIKLPSLPEQKSIAKLLSSFDDKIGLLYRQNETLEQMAETLFRQWFVEEAQQDWKERPLSSIANFLNGLACQNYPPKNDANKLPVMKIKQLRNGLSEDCDWCTTDVKPEYIVNRGDVVFSWSASLIVKIWDDEKCILNQHLFKVTSDEFPKWFYYLWIKHHLEEFTNISSSHATTMGHIKRGDLDNAIVLVPPNDLIEKYSKILTPTLEKIITNNKQISLFKDLRDTLLPKLMSGEVRVAHEEMETV